MTSKSFPIEVLISAESDRLLCPFDQLHEFIEHVLGRSVWTHEMADPATMQELRDATYRALPSLRNDDGSSAFGSWRIRNFAAITHENYRDALDAFRVAHPHIPSTVEVPLGSSQRTESPLDSLRRMVPDENIVVVATEVKP